MHDLTTVEGVKAYLQTTPFASSSVTALSGGIANWTYRLQLVEPYEGQDTLVLKHTRDYLSWNSERKLSVERQVSLMLDVARFISPDL